MLPGPRAVPGSARGLCGSAGLAGPGEGVCRCPVPVTVQRHHGSIWVLDHPHLGFVSLLPRVNLRIKVS